MKSLLLCLSLLVCLPAMAGDRVNCKGTTKAGKQCSRQVTPPAEYCYQHNPSTLKCDALTKKGVRCQCPAKKGLTKCRFHYETLVGHNPFNQFN